MKIFLSWSGEYSHKIAKLFADWVPSVIQSTEVFISTGGISAGERWLPKISSALDDIDFGLVFVTEMNKQAPWLMFEAGALAKNVAAARVVPVLCGAEDDIEFKKNPLSHFQYVKLEEDGIFRAMKSIFDVSSDTKLTEQLFENSLQTWWPKLQNDLEGIEKPKRTDSQKKEAQPDDRLGALESTISQLIGEIRSQNANSISRLRNAFVHDKMNVSRFLNDDALSNYIRNEELSNDLISREDYKAALNLQVYRDTPKKFRKNPSNKFSEFGNVGSSSKKPKK